MPASDREECPNTVSSLSAKPYTTRATLPLIRRFVQGVFDGLRIEQGSNVVKTVQPLRSTLSTSSLSFLRAQNSACLPSPVSPRNPVDRIFPSFTITAPT